MITKNTTYIIKGRTFPVKNILRDDFGARWDNARRAWVVVGSLSFKSLQEIRGLGPKIWVVTE